MFLKFIGSGSALNTVLGNNNAFIKNGESLLLIDCGSTAFSKLQSLNLLKGIKKIYVLITHRHPDHISSLGDLIFYAHYLLKAEVQVLTPDVENVVRLLDYMGVQQELFGAVKLNEKFNLIDASLELNISPIAVQHVSQMDCYGYIIQYQGLSIYYSGDSSDIPSAVLQAFNSKELDYIFQDTCSYNYPDNPHLYLAKLCDLIPKADRDRVFCMHYDEKFDKLQTLQMGFQLVKNFNE